MIEVRNASGVLLRYDCDAIPATAARGPSDRLRCLLRRASRQARTLRILIEHLEEGFSEVAIDRVSFALHTIEAALELAREEML